MAVVPILLAVGAAFTAYSSIRQGQAASNAADYNAKVAQQNATATMQQEQQASIAQQRDTALKLGTLSANQGASGLDPSTGSPLDVLSSSIQQATLDNLNLKYNYQMKALGYQNTSTLDSVQSSNDSTAGYLNAAGSALGGATGIAKYEAGSGGGIPVMPGGY